MEDSAPSEAQQPQTDAYWMHAPPEQQQQHQQQTNVGFPGVAIRPHPQPLQPPSIPQEHSQTQVGQLVPSYTPMYPPSQSSQISVPSQSQMSWSSQCSSQSAPGGMAPMFGHPQQPPYAFQSSRQELSQMQYPPQMQQHAYQLDSKGSSSVLPPLGQPIHHQQQLPPPQQQQQHQQQQHQLQHLQHQHQLQHQQQQQQQQQQLQPLPDSATGSQLRSQPIPLSSLRAIQECAPPGRGPPPPYAIATTNNHNAMVKRSKLLKANSAPEIMQSDKKSMRNSRRRHRNSHLGCATCKSRRIKCDEQLPECHNCVRARLSCAYLALDDTARAALKSAQHAHANRIQTLNMQASQREAQKNEQLYYPYQHQGLPSRIFMVQPPHSDAHVFQLQLNLQRTVLPDRQFQYQHLQQLQDRVPIPERQTNGQQVQQQQHQHHQLKQQEVQHQVQQAQHRPIVSPTKHRHETIVHAGPSLKVPAIATSTALRSVTSDPLPKSQSSEPSSPDFSANRDAQFTIKSDAYKTLFALLKVHKDIDKSNDVDYLSQFDSEFTEIILDAKCTKSLNTFWKADTRDLITKELNFTTESLYLVFDKFQSQLLKEAFNNIVLFKCLISQGAAPIVNNGTSKDIRDIVRKIAERDYEITLRFLNKFHIKFTTDYSDINTFYNNVSLCFSKFQIFQMALPTAFYGPYNLKDIYELINSFFKFTSEYLKHEFQVFLSDDIPENVKENKVFQRAEILNDHMHLFIIYYVQSIKTFHTRSYNTLFMDEFLQNLTDLKRVIYENLSKTYRGHFDNLFKYIKTCTDYWHNTQSGTETNRIQVIFYSLKKFTEIFPDEAYIGCVSRFEEQMVHLYFQAAMYSLKAIYAETNFFFLHSFNARNGFRYSDELLRAIDSDRYTTEQRAMMRYPAMIMKFFRERGLLIGKYLRSVAQFPAKIMLDENNRDILMNLVQEEQIVSFKEELKNDNYPHIDETSNFFQKETDSIVIPSVSNTDFFSNFDASQTKRNKLMSKAIEMELSEADKTLLDCFYKSNDGMGEIPQLVDE